MQFELRLRFLSPEVLEERICFDGPWKLTGHLEWVCGLWACLPGPLQTVRVGRICSLPPALPFNKLSSLSLLSLSLMLLPCLVAICTFHTIPHICCCKQENPYKKQEKPSNSVKITRQKILLWCYLIISHSSILMSVLFTSCCLLAHKSMTKGPTSTVWM